MIIITDNLKKPFDEGAKIATKKIVEYLKKQNSAYVISLNSNDEFTFVDISFSINRLLLNRYFLNELKKHQNQKILYIPSGSASFFSILRSNILKYFAKKKIFLFALQPRRYGFLTQLFLKVMHPKEIISLSQKTASFLRDKLKIPSISIPLGVDSNQYFEFDSARKKLARKTFNVAPDKTVILHAGHVQRSRNLEWLVTVKRQQPDFEIIIVGSTYSEDDKTVYDMLIREEIRIIREYIPSMVDIYNISDFYVFPVLKQDGAIETPLSVLEAMACNLPVITTRFGSLPDTFVDDDDFCFAESSQDIAAFVTSRKKKTCKNREKIIPYTWESISEKLVEVVESQ